MSTKDGGPAFPRAKTSLMRDHTREASRFTYDISGDDGMTLRDWFAGQALAGIMAQSHAGPKDWTKPGFGWGEDTLNSLNKHETSYAATVAGFAYQMADAMIEERSK